MSMMIIKSVNYFNDVISIEELKQIMPQATDQKVLQFQEEFNKHLPDFNITTPMRLAAFLAEGASDSSELTALTDNLNYTTARLLQIWPDKFRSFKEAQQYSNNPQKLGNYMYANKMGNGNQLSGDGYRYRGRGFFKITGFENYNKMKQAIGVDFVTYPDLITAPRYAVLTACIIWNELNLNSFADEGNIKTLFKKINILNTNLQEKISYYNKAKIVLKK
jgi:putative chitinase